MVWRVLVALVLFVAAIVSPPAAHASCLSFSGLISIGSGCSSSFGTLAVGIGANSRAAASGVLSVAVATGGATVTTNGPLDLAYGGGGSTVSASGLLGIAVSLGGDNTVRAGPGVANVALVVGDHNTVSASGLVNLAANLGSQNTVIATGTLTNAVNLVGTRNRVVATGTLTSAWNVNGRSNTVVAGPGPLSVAAAFRWIGTNAFRSTPGVNIRLPRITIGGPSARDAGNGGGTVQPRFPRLRRVLHAS